MSESTSQTETTLAVENGDPVVIDAETVLDEAYEALSNDRRRRVLSAVTRGAFPLDVETLARRVTVEEACAASKMVTEESTRQVHLSLYHHHLPKLADADLIEYDAEEKVVEGLGDAIDSVHV